MVSTTRWGDCTCYWRLSQRARLSSSAIATLLVALLFTGPITTTPLQSPNSVVKLEVRDSSGCYGFNHCSCFAPDHALTLAKQACKNLDVGLIPNGQTKGTWQYEDNGTGFYVYVGFTSNKSGGWYVDTNFCNNVVRDIINSCTDKDFGTTNGGFWNYDNQGVANVDTGPDKQSKSRRGATCWGWLSLQPRLLMLWWLVTQCLFVSTNNLHGIGICLATNTIARTNQLVQGN